MSYLGLLRHKNLTSVFLHVLESYNIHFIQSWIPIKAGFPSKIIIKIVFIVCFFLMLEYSTTFFLFLSTFSLCGFQSYNFCLDGALKNSFFSIAGCMKVVKVKGVYSWLCGFLQCASFRTLKVDKLPLKFDL